MVDKRKHELTVLKENIEEYCQHLAGEIYHAQVSNRSSFNKELAFHTFVSFVFPDENAKDFVNRYVTEHYKLMGKERVSFNPLTRRNESY